MAGQTDPTHEAGQFRMLPCPGADGQPDDGSGFMFADQGPRPTFQTGQEEFEDDLREQRLEDRRAERQKLGLIKYSLEKGVPDVGGLGWRSKQGHVLKNQSYYSAFPNTNIWNNPAHAGPRTWKSFHGPRLRTDAALMENLDRLDKEQADWEAKKMYVNTVRVQTLDRFYQQKVENEQHEIHHTWAPHRRAKREYHEGHNRFEAELDSMPMKELKKVLTPAVLHGDREAVRNITQRIQREETWKATWKEMEVQRRKDTLDDFEERMTYNHMLADLAGQPTRRRDPNYRLPNNCSERVEELARPKAEAHITDVTRLTDFRGLVHIDHEMALEARFPGQGMEMSKTFREKANSSSAAGWPPPDRPATPQGNRKRDPKNLSGSLKRGSIPASASTLSKALNRTTDDDYSQKAPQQVNPNKAPPPPDQRKAITVDKMVNDPEVLSEMLSQSDPQSHSVSSILPSTQKYSAQKPPPTRPYVYPVLVDVAPNSNDRAKARLGGNLSTDANATIDSTATATAEALGATSFGGTMASTNSGDWKQNLPRKEVKVARLGINLIGATGLRGADRNGLSDPFCVVRIPGRPKSKYQTRVLTLTTNPMWRESCEIEEYFSGDVLEFAVYDKDAHGRDCLGKATLTQEELMPDGVAGELMLFDEQQPEAGPSLRMKVVVLENFDPDGVLQAKAVRGMEDSDDEPPPDHEACQALDEFEASLRPVPRLGNFWMTPRGDMRHGSHDGGAVRSARGQQSR